MQRSPGPRKTAILSESVHRQINAYALAASAAGVGVLALTQPTEAKIVYTRTHQVIGPGQHYDLDLNHDKITDFTLVNSWTISISAQFLYLNPAQGNSEIGYVGHDNWRFASAMKKGSAIGPRGHFQARTAVMFGVRASQGGGTYGPWYNATNRYLGLKLEVKGKPHYGWARLTVKGTFASVTETLTGYAYETIPNRPIIAGKTHGKDAITSELESLGHLARGASAIPSWR